MKNFYDKLILLIAVFAVAGGVRLYLQKTAKARDLESPVKVQPADKPYVAVPVPETPSAEAEWPDAPEQSTGWTYDVFTPPKIYLDENGQFTAEGWVPPPPEEPFGIYLVGLERDAYRIQIQGYIEEDRQDPSKNLVLLYDEERGVPVRLRAGDRNEAAELEVLDFNIERKINAQMGEVEIIAQATIRDLRTGEELSLTEGERRYNNGITVSLRSNEDPSFGIELTEAGVTFENERFQYKLLSINLEENSITVEKLPSEEGRESEILTLKPQQNMVKVPESPSALSSPSSATMPTMLF